MLVAGFPAGAFAANCYIVATAPGEQCVIIDPGQDAMPGIEEILAEHRLRPAAVLLTHGHIDHVWSVAPVCDAQGIPAYIHPADRALLSDPARRAAWDRQHPPRAARRPHPSAPAWPAGGAALRAGPVRIEPPRPPGPGGSSGPEPLASPAVLAWLAYWLRADPRERPW